LVVVATYLESSIITSLAFGPGGSILMLAVLATISSP
jgi:hypothetical protein